MTVLTKSQHSHNIWYLLYFEFQYFQCHRQWRPDRWCGTWLSAALLLLGMRQVYKSDSWETVNVPFLWNLYNDIKSRTRILHNLSGWNSARGDQRGRKHVQLNYHLLLWWYFFTFILLPFYLFKKEIIIFVSNYRYLHSDPSLESQIKKTIQNLLRASTA